VTRSGTRATRGVATIKYQSEWRSKWVGARATISDLRFPIPDTRVWLHCILIRFGLRIFLDWPTSSRARLTVPRRNFRPPSKSGDVTFASAALGHLYGTVGKTAEARAVYSELSARANRVYVPAYDIALVCAGLGWKDQALDYLARADQERSGWMTYLKWTRAWTRCVAMPVSSNDCGA